MIRAVAALAMPRNSRKPNTSVTVVTATAETAAWMAPTLAPEPLPADPDQFWGECEWGDDDDLIGPARVPDESAALPRQRGRLPFWQGSEEFLPALDAVYAQALQAGLELYLGAE